METKTTLSLGQFLVVLGIASAVFWLATCGVEAAGEPPEPEATAKCLPGEYADIETAGQHLMDLEIRHHAGRKYPGRMYLYHSKRVVVGYTWGFVPWFVDTDFDTPGALQYFRRQSTIASIDAVCLWEEWQPRTPIIGTTKNPPRSL